MNPQFLLGSSDIFIWKSSVQRLCNIFLQMAPLVAQGAYNAEVPLFKHR